ncbi:hypothetical protein Q3G72_008072 [Acer saccharum]|nr:hypothetical protein Q3G72_008072 [Acer saccharum]
MNCSRILAFKNKLATVVEPFPKDFFSSYVHQSKPAKSRRYIPQSSKKTLDALDIQDNFYLNLLDWDPEMALKKLVTVDDKDGLVTGVSLAPNGRHIVVGLNNSHVQIWDSTAIQKVCVLLCSIHERELLNSHGFTENQLTLWKYTSMVNMAELTGHTSRVLFMAQSPNGYIVASATGDKTLRFWNVFGTSEVAKKPVSKTKYEPFAHLSCIR